MEYAVSYLYVYPGNIRQYFYCGTRQEAERLADGLRTLGLRLVEVYEREAA